MHNRFEKEVQKKMEELNLVPSPPVWKKIELEIRPEKKKRRVILWLFFGLVFLGGGVFTYRLVKEHEQTAGSMPTTQSSDAKTKLKKASYDKENTLVRQEPKKITNSITTEVTIQKQPGLFRNKNSNASSRQKLSYASSKNQQTLAISKEPVAAKQNSSLVNLSLPQTQTSQNKELPVEKTAIIVSNDKLLEKDEKPTTLLDTVSSLQKSINDSIAISKEVEPVLIPAATDSSIKKKVASKKAWKKAINFSIGKSDYIAGSFLKFSPARFDAAYQSPITSGTPGSVASSSPSEIKSGPAFTTGFSLSKKLSQHFEISFGLQYAYYSTTTKVGNSRTNNTVQLSNGVYFNVSRSYTNSPTNNNTYTNQFHAVEIPVSVSWQPALHLPLYVSAGAAYGHLLSTNALGFSTSSNAYYPDEDNYVQHMLPLFTSVQAGLFEKKKVSLRIGPMLQYNALKLKKTNAGEAAHLYFAGIRSAVFF